MDDNQFKNPQEVQGQNTFLRIALIGLLEIGFVIFFLLVIFGILNYFGILKVPFLSFLPTKNQSTNTQTTTNQNIIMPTGILSQKAQKPSQLPVAYDPFKTNAVLIKYVQQSLQPQYIPTSVYQNTSPFLVNNNAFSLAWTVGTQQFGAFLTLDKDKQPQSYQMQIGMNYANTSAIPSSVTPAEQAPTEEQAKAYISRYFNSTNVPDKMNCTADSTVGFFCSSLKRINDTEKDGYSVFLKKVSFAIPLPLVTVVQCKVFKTDPNFDTLTSCLLY